MGIACRRYNNLGRIFIFKIEALPNQEKRPVCQPCRSLWIFCKVGKKLVEYRLDSLVGSLIPRYVKASNSQPKGKFCLHWDTKASGRVILRAFDLSKFICRLEILLNSVKSLRRLGIVVIGSDRNNRMSSP